MTITDLQGKPMTTLRPVGDHVIVRPLETNETKSGLVLADVAQDDVAGDRLDMIHKYNKLCLAKVLAVGVGDPVTELVRDHEGNVTGTEHPGGREEIDLQPGELIMYERAGGVRVPWLDGEAVAIRSEHVMFAVEGDARQVLGGLATGKVDDDG